MNGSGSVAVQSLQTRYWIRLERPRWAWLPWGVLPWLALLGLVLFGATWFARQTIQDTVQREIQADLIERGYGWVKVSVSGQQVTLSGIEPKTGSGALAVDLARQTPCHTFFGLATCAISVDGDFRAAPRIVPQPVVSKREDLCDQDFAKVLRAAQIQFATAKAALAPASAQVISNVAAIAKRCPGQLTIEGHTDSVGSRASNVTLSQGRAEAVRRALIQQGVEAKRLRAVGFGPDRPVQDNSSDAGRAKNRRIEVRMVRE